MSDMSWWQRLAGREPVAGPDDIDVPDRPELVAVDEYDAEWDEGDPESREQDQGPSIAE